MTRNEYQQQAKQTAIYPTGHITLSYLVIALCGESGELANLWKKRLRDHCGSLTTDARTAMALEMGDVLWYLAALATELGYSLEEIAQMNLDKLAKRKRANALSDGTERMESE